jgi:hypothetical protein
MEKTIKVKDIFNLTEEETAEIDTEIKKVISETKTIGAAAKALRLPDLKKEGYKCFIFAMIACDHQRFINENENK